MVTTFPPAEGPLRGLTAVTVGRATGAEAGVVVVSGRVVVVSPPVPARVVVDPPSIVVVEPPPRLVVVAPTAVVVEPPEAVVVVPPPVIEQAATTRTSPTTNPTAVRMSSTSFTFFMMDTSLSSRAQTDTGYGTLPPALRASITPVRTLEDTT
jgi:hypothetical protein